MRLTSLLLVAACYQARTLSGSPDGGGPGTDGLPSDGDGSSVVCYGHRLPICLAAPPTGTLDLVFASSEVSTDSCETFGGTLYPPAVGSPTACLFAARSIRVPATGNPQRIRFTGNLAVVLLGVDLLQIDSGVELSVTSETVGTKGAGAGNPNCEDGTTSDGGGASGGAGGSFGSVGGFGGAGKSSANGGTPGNAVIPPSLLVGGCSGGVGGGNSFRANGGGAIELVTDDGNGAITIVGRVTAHGAGGRGGGLGAIGGDGGGTGGFILLDSPTITITGTVAANGGAGGQGGATSAGNNGDTATDANQALASMNVGGGALGGDGSPPTGGGGGSGQPSQQSGDGAGAGGGGEGFILYPLSATTTTVGAKLAPPMIPF